MLYLLADIPYLGFQYRTCMLNYVANDSHAITCSKIGQERARFHSAHEAEEFREMHVSCTDDHTSMAMFPDGAI